MSEVEVVGPHLLGRLPSPPDERDYKLANFLPLGDVEMGSSDPLDLITIAEQELKLTTVTFKKWASTAYPDVTRTHWFKALNALAQAKEALAPAPPSDVFEWPNPQPILNQEDTNHCVGFSGAQWGNTLPVNDQYTDRDGHAIYYECKVIDGEPGEENGSYIRSLGQALKARKRVTAYAFAANVEEAIEWLKVKGPVVAGTNWYDDMFFPDSFGLVAATGPLVGGHAYLMNGFDPNTDELLYINSWGKNWGADGHFRLSLMDAKMLHTMDGELMVTLELPIA